MFDVWRVLVLDCEALAPELDVPAVEVSVPGVGALVELGFDTDAFVGPLLLLLVDVPALEFTVS